MKVRFIFLVGLYSILCGSTVNAVDYQSRLTGEIERCLAVPAMQSHGGLLFNPEGYRSYWGRSACYQKLALKYRQPAFCGKVFQRYSLLSSSWGYSESNCLELVNQSIVEDTAKIERMRDGYEHGPVRLVDAVLQKNGNGRDFDLLPRFTLGFPGSYMLYFYLEDKRAGKLKILQQAWYLGEQVPNLNLYIPLDKIVSKLKDFDEFDNHLLLFELELILPLGRGSAWWPPDWLETIWPRTQRLQVLRVRKRINPWQPMEF